MFAALSIIVVIMFQKIYKQIENTNRVESMLRKM